MIGFATAFGIVRLLVLWKKFFKYSFYKGDNVMCLAAIWYPGLILSFCGFLKSSYYFKLIWVCREKDTDIAFAQEQIDDYKVSCEE